MFARFVYVKLKEEWSNSDGRRSVIEESARVLPNIPGVLRCRAGVPADEHAEKGWDVCINLEFDSLEAVEVYRVHPKHQVFLDDYLLPKTEAKRVWNFEMTECKVSRMDEG